MEYHDQFVVDFVKRTRRNLEYIETQVEQNPDLSLYEVTQLVNSLLGIIVLQKSTTFRISPKRRSRNWQHPVSPIVDKLIGKYPERCKTLRELVTNLRHAIADFKIEFIADRNNTD